MGRYLDKAREALRLEAANVRIGFWISGTGAVLSVSGEWTHWGETVARKPWADGVLVSVPLTAQERILFSGLQPPTLPGLKKIEGKEEP